MIGLFITELDIKGGTHKQLLYLLNYLEANKKPFKVVTSKLDYTKTYEGFSRYKNDIVCINRKLHHFLPMKLYYTVSFIIKIKKALKGIAVLNIHNLGLELYLPFFYNKKIIWQINDLPGSFLVGIDKDKKVSFKNRLLQRYLRFCSRLFVKAIAVNVTKNKERVQDSLKMNAEVFYCGIEKIDIEKDVQRSTERCKAHTINLLTSGVFFPYRNYETQVEVVKILKENGYAVQLDIIGSTALDNQYAAKVLQLIIENHLEKEIKIRGQVAETEFKKLHTEADIFLFINVDQSWGLAVFEAMSCGLPVIVSNSVGATEILHAGIDAVFVNPLDAQQIAAEIELLATDKNAYLQYANNGINFCKKYTWDNAYSRHICALIEKYEQPFLPYK